MCVCVYIYIYIYIYIYTQAGFIQIPGITCVLLWSWGNDYSNRKWNHRNLPGDHKIDSKKSGSTDRGKYLTTQHKLSALCQRLSLKDSIYMKSIWLDNIQHFENISTKSSPNRIQPVYMNISVRNSVKASISTRRLKEPLGKKLVNTVRKMKTIVIKND